MPVAFPLIAPLLGQVAIWGAGLGLSTVALTGLVTATSLLLQGGLLIGAGLALTAVARLFAPPPPKPEERQNMIRQAAYPRFRSYGRVKVGGVLAFISVANGILYRVLLMGQGRIDAVEEHWVDSNVIELDGSGVAIGEPYDGAVKIDYRLGTESQTAYSDLISAFPLLWSSDHRGNGMPHALMQVESINLERFPEVFPRGEPNYRQVQRAALVYNPTDGAQSPDDESTWVWSDNAALIIADFLTHADALGLPRSYLQTPLAAKMWERAIAICDEGVALAAGGAESRWRIWGSYGFDERPADVVNRFVDACDAVFIPTPDNGLGIKVGKWEEPTVVIDEDIITGHDLQHGIDIMSAANTIKAQFTSPLHDYQSVDADPWTDEESVTARGELTREMQLYCAPSHSQCRRLMKIAAARANPNWTGTVRCNLKALPVLGERYFTMRLDELGIDETFELQKFDWIFGDESILMGVMLTVASISSAAYDWTTAEEGTPPAEPEDLVSENAPPEPQNLVVTIQVKSASGGISYAVARLTWNAVADYLQVQARMRLSTETEWQAVPVQPNATAAVTGALEDGKTYQFQVRSVSLTGRVSNWVPDPPEEKTVTVDTAAPGQAVNVTAAGGVGQATVTLTSPDSDNYWRTKIFRNTVNDFGTAAASGFVYGSPDTAGLSKTVTGLAAGTYYFWARTENRSGVTAAAVASTPASVTVT